MPVTLSVIKQKIGRSYRPACTRNFSNREKKDDQTNGNFEGNVPGCFCCRIRPGKANFERVSYSYTDILTKNIEVDFDHIQAV